MAVEKELINVLSHETCAKAAFYPLLRQTPGKWGVVKFCLFVLFLFCCFFHLNFDQLVFHSCRLTFNECPPCYGLSTSLVSFLFLLALSLISYGKLGSPHLGKGHSSRKSERYLFLTVCVWYFRVSEQINV